MTSTASTLSGARVFFGRRAQLIYELLAWVFRNETDVRFMNYGFAGGSNARLLSASEEFERTCAQLYDAVAGQVDLVGARVLDVGSGRGGGASFIQRHLGAFETVGFELARCAVSFARRVHAGTPGLSFRQGDAGALPFPAERFDAVVSVESAHCYPDRPAFLSEAFRVLRPGGHLLFADFTSRASSPEAERGKLELEFDLAGFGRVQGQDITANILSGLDLDDARRRREICRRFPLGTRRMALYWAGTQGSWIYRDFAEGRRSYLMYRIVKPLVELPALSPQHDAARSGLRNTQVAALDV